MSFHLGKPVLVMLLLAMASGGVVLLRPNRLKKADLTVWAFADLHARSYREGLKTKLAHDAAAGGTDLIVASSADFRPGERLRVGEGQEMHRIASIAPGRIGLEEPLKAAHRAGVAVTGQSLIEQYEQRTGKSVEVILVPTRAEEVRLLSMFYNDSAVVPDLVEIEISSVGKFFGPPTSEVGFLPLNSFIEREGLQQQMVASRFAPWSKGQTIFGVPHDVHPVTITYRKDLFDQAGVDLAQARTWDQFHEMGLKFQAYWKSRGVSRYAMALPTADADRLRVFLLQRDINLIDSDNRVHINDPNVADTVARYALMVAGPRRIAADETPGGNLWARDFATGSLAACMTPDWRVGYLKTIAADVAGKAAMMPLPLWAEGDSPTTTWGGTMMGIPRNCKDPEESWRLLKWLYLSDEGGRARDRYTNVLPAVRAQWQQRVDERDPYYAGQQTWKLMAELAEKIPSRHTTPFTPAAKEALSIVLARAVNYVENNGEPGLREACQRWLDELAVDLRKMIDRGSFQ